MMRSSHVAGTGAGVLLGLVLLCQAAQAAPGYLNQGMNLRAGPGVDYPWIASLPQGTQTEIFGCLPGWSWCDVATEGLRGWVAGVGLQVLYEDQPEPLAGYGTEIGLPFVGFDFGSYWGRNYRGRPWFSDVDRWHGPGGPRDDRGGPPGQPYGDGRGYRGSFGGRGPEGGGPGDFAGPGRGPGGFQGGQPGGFGGPARSGPPGFNRGNEPGGPQPQARFQGGGAPPGGGPGRGVAGPGQPGPRPGGGGQHGPQGPGPDHGGPGQHDPR